MKRVLTITLLIVFCLSGCGAKPQPAAYRQIDQETAKEMMKADGTQIIVDVRRQDEYDAGHIPGAVLIPNESIGTERPEALPDLDQIILVYCRSGNRSKQAAQKLADMGYTNVYEFGGIIDWTEDIVTDTELEESEGAEDTAEESVLVRISVEEHSITATLYDNEATRALWDMLPQTFPMMNLYGREMCYRMGNGALPDGTASDMGYEIGDISYWPPAGSLVILYKQNGEVFEQVKIGHTDDDVSFFDGMEDSEITFEKIAEEESGMKLFIGEKEVPVSWENNTSVEALKEFLPLTIQMSMYGGFEQVGPIGQSIIRDDVQTVTDFGDIVLYAGNQIVVFYGSNSWAYTRLGHVNLSKQEMTDMLSNGDVTITITEG